MNDQRAAKQPHEEPDKKEEPTLYCPVCNNRLVESRCKLVCERCGYYMSCADYY